MFGYEAQVLHFWRSTCLDTDTDADADTGTDTDTPRGVSNLICIEKIEHTARTQLKHDEKTAGLKI